MHLHLPSLLAFLPFIHSALAQEAIPPGPVKVQVYLHDNSFDTSKPCTSNRPHGCLTHHGTWNEQGQDCAIFTSDGAGALRTEGKLLSLDAEKVLHNSDNLFDLLWYRNDIRFAKVPKDFLYLADPETNRAYGPFWYGSSKKSDDGSELRAQPSQEFPRGTYGLCFEGVDRDEL
ncbi:hypothetical protein BJY04DRAFT_122436 [Aspergillus karnatakaensis]|uniref:uncharacterized protein n=1 Tax=Aspergillus karnatakaensis TaxID=1810916 RepID=UPI003CCE2CA5